MSRFSTASRPVALFLALALVALSTPASGRSLEDDATRAERWKVEMQRIDTALVEGRWEVAERRVDRLLGEMMNELRGGEAAAGFLATAVTLRAVAKAGQGEADAARWDLGVARALHPYVRTVPLAAYGSLVSGILAVRLDTPDLASGASSGVEPPRRIEARPPEYPATHRIACLEGPVTLDAVVGPDGRLRSVLSLASAHPVLALATAEAVRNWRFEPARRDGVPVEFRYTLDLDFELRRCLEPVDERSSPEVLSGTQPHVDR